MIPAAVLALFASLAYGTSDFVADVSGRRASSVAVAYTMPSAERGFCPKGAW